MPELSSHMYSIKCSVFNFNGISFFFLLFNRWNFYCTRCTFWIIDTQQTKAHTRIQTCKTRWEFSFLFFFYVKAREKEKILDLWNNYCFYRYMYIHELTIETWSLTEEQVVKRAKEGRKNGIYSVRLFFLLFSITNDVVTPTT